MLWRMTLLTNPDRCNLQCALCFLKQRRHQFGKGEMPWEIAEKAVRKFAVEGIREVIRSTMGEPLLYTHFEKLEALVRELHLKLNVTTNGSFPMKGARAWAQELLPISSDIKVSCWGFSEKVWKNLCVGMDVSQYKKNLREFLQVRNELAEKFEELSKISLQMAVCKTNRDDVERVLEWALELGCNRVKLNRAVFLSQAEELKKREAIPSEEFFDSEKWKNLPLKIEGTFLKPEEKWQQKNCPFLGREIWVLPDGSTEPCPDPENRFVEHLASENRCDNCHLFPKNIQQLNSFLLKKIVKD